MRNSLCCMGLTIASRMISTYTLAFSILLINVFTSQLLIKVPEGDFFRTLESWAPVGLGWTFIFKHIQLDDPCEIIAIACSTIIVYSSLFFITSAYLAYGSTVRESKYAVPWLYMQMISIIDQTASLTIQLLQEGYEIFKKSTLYAILCCTYLILNIYFWMIVEGARKEWSKQIENQVPQTSENLITNEVPVKSPSYVSTSLMVNQQPSTFQQSNDLPSYDSLTNVT
ncbi:uncharacterized protein LOC122517689 [Polistes fuscatus]|uniref:uncharacterized protein LOC122517689 n=1 Tax=Polistes fuscatus TaxID=30207 RepID=UPI001CA96E0C|nr:uncharacterized protein LOC122517689 [Polistes fuscatus]